MRDLHNGMSRLALVLAILGFATAAAALAKAGGEISRLTYRQVYVDAPEGQWQGYKDTTTDRAWGVTEWNRRAGQAAYFNWAVANALVPSVNPVACPELQWPKLNGQIYHHHHRHLHQ